MRKEIPKTLMFLTFGLLLVGCTPASQSVQEEQPEVVQQDTQRQDGETIVKEDDAYTVPELSEGVVAEDQLHAWNEAVDYQELSRQCRYQLKSVSFTQDLAEHDSTLLTGDFWLDEDGNVQDHSQWIAWIDLSVGNTSEQTQVEPVNSNSFVAVDPETLAVTPLYGEAIYIDPIQSEDPHNRSIVTLQSGETSEVLVGYIIDISIMPDGNDVYYVLGSLGNGANGSVLVPNTAVFLDVTEFWNER